MRKLGAGAVMLSAGVMVGVVIGGGLPFGGAPVAVAASPEAARAESYDVAAAESFRGPAARATSTDSGVISFDGQSLPDLLVAPPSRTDGRLKLSVGLGDSITYRAGSWFRRVCGAGVLDTCRDAGVRGDTTAGMLARLDTDVLALRPQLVTIMAGTNDMRDAVPTATTLRNLQRLTSRVQASGATVVLCTVAPRNRTPEQALALNAEIRKYAVANDIPLLDIYPALGNSRGRFRKGLTADGVHPNAAGMKAMADLAEAELPQVLG